MPIPKDEFERIDEDGSTLDLASDTSQGKVYQFLLENAGSAFRQREIIDAVDVPGGSVGPILSRLEQHDLVDHRGRYWKVADAEHAVASATRLGAATADTRDGGFSDEEIEAWMETAVDPIDDHDVDREG